MKLKPKKVIIILIGVISSHIASGQGTYEIAYKHLHQIDTSKPLSKAYTKDALLIGNSMKSIYVYNVGTTNPKDTIKVDYRNFQELLNAANEGKIAGTQKATISGGIPFDKFGDQILFEKKSDSLYSRVKMIKEYVLVAEKRQTINWQLSDDEKKIQGFNCKKATGTYRGRNYTAWYSSEIPIPEGPYKFKGLPGLILEIEDDREELKIWADNIKYPVKSEIPLFIASGKPITFQEYLKFMGKENEAIINSFLAAEQNQPGYEMGASKPMPLKKNSFCQIELTE
jgi:GLPGLI family protein